MNSLKADSIRFERLNGIEHVEVRDVADLKEKLRRRGALCFLLKLQSYSDVVYYQADHWTSIDEITQKDFDWLTQDTKWVIKSILYATQQDGVAGFR